MGISPEQFKTALSHWPSGVSVVTSRATVHPVGMTVSAFFSASLIPPLIGICLDRKAATLAAISESRYFAVNVLSADQSALSDTFAWVDELRRFDGVPLVEGVAAKSPLIAGAVAHLDCDVESTHDAGDHVLCLGRVLLALVHPGDPLLFHDSRYHRLAPLNRG